MEIGDLGLRALHLGPHLIQGRAEIPVVNARKHLAGAHRLIIVHENGRNITRYPGGDDGRVSLHICIIRGDDETRGCPVEPSPGYRQNQYQRPGDHPQEMPS